MTAEPEALQLQRDWIVACEVARDTGDELRKARAKHVVAQAYRKSAYLAYAHALGWDLEDVTVPKRPLDLFPQDVTEAPPAQADEAPAVPAEDRAEVTVGEAPALATTCPECYHAEGGTGLGSCYVVTCVCPRRHLPRRQPATS